MDKLIDWRMYDPSKPNLFGKKSDRAVFTTLTCSNSDNCPAYKRGGCAVWNGLGGTHCPYGKRMEEEGFTPRAQKYRNWIRERREQVAGIEQLTAWKKIAVIGDYVYFPYSFWSIGMKSIDQRFRDGAFNDPDKFLPREMFTVDLFDRIVNARPRALMGGEITKYQAEIVPKIILHTRQELPDFFDEWIKKYPKTAKRFESLNYVGMRAYLKTLRPGARFTHKNGEMFWDGRVLRIEDYNSVSFPLNKWESATLIITPSDETIIEITDNEQVTEFTKFV